MNIRRLIRDAFSGLLLTAAMILAALSIPGILLLALSVALMWAAWLITRED